MSKRFKLSTLQKLTDDYSYEDKHLTGFKITIEDGDKYIEFTNDKKDLEIAEELDIKILHDLSEIYPKIEKLSKQYDKDVDAVDVENIINSLQHVLYNINKRDFLINGGTI